jgi:hypothetical protein
MRIDPGALVAPSPRLEYVFGFYLDPDEAKRALDPLDAAAILLGERPVPTAASNQGLAMLDGSAAVRQRAEPIAENSLAGTFGRLAERLVEGLESRIKSGNGPYGDGSGVPEPVFGEAAAGTGHASSAKAAPDSLPSDSRVIMSTSPGLFSLAIPRNGLKSPGFWLSSGFAVFWLGFVAFWTFSALVMGAPIFFAMFSLPFWALGIFLVKSLLKPALTSIAASVTKEGGLVFEERFLGKPRVRSWPLSDIGACRIENSPISQNGRHDRDLCIEAGAKEVRFGRSLSERERRAVASALNLWLSEARGAS